MKITILGAGGNIGKRIVAEAASRNQELNLITSKKAIDFQLENPATIASVDIFDTEKLTEAFKGSDVVISSYAPPQDHNDLLIEASRSLVQAAKAANTRLITVGGAGSLQIGKDALLIDAPAFPEEYKGVAKAHLTALNEVYRKENELNWTNASPAAYIFEGERTGKFQLGGDYLIANEKGESAISMEDFAVAILDEVTNANYIKQRFTAGY